MDSQGAAGAGRPRRPDIATATDGPMHYVATYTDYSGKPQTETDDVDFDVTGYATASGQDVTLSVK